MTTILDDKTRAHQAVRMRRLWMTVGSQCPNFVILALCTVYGFLEPQYAAGYILMVVAISLVFYLSFRFHWNLRCTDANLTAPQLLLALIPGVWIMYFVNDGQVRTSYMLVAIVPLLYGLLGLSPRRFAWVGALSFIMQTGMLCLVMVRHPEAANPRAEGVVIASLLVLIIQIAFIGGYVTSLRAKLRARNGELNIALARIGRMANQDELTGLHNRRFLLQVIEREFDRCQRGGGPFSLCFVDIDHFKTINDTYGHPVGDEVLKKVSGSIGRGVRNIDCFGRYGGEEFLLIMPQTSIDTARFLAEMLRMAVEQLAFTEIANELRVTVSAGVAQYCRGESLHDTIARADLALYQAKATGRNRVIGARDPALCPLESE